MTLVKDKQNVSPMMQQWHDCKEKANDAVLLFQMGDFYEAFYEDAETLSSELDLTLTKRQDIPMAGVPLHTCETYISKLLEKGFCVAIAEQTEDPKKTKGLVNREIVRIVTPGTVLNSSFLQEKANNFCASVTQVGSLYGLAFVDLTTSEFYVVEFEDLQDLANEVYRIRPSEILCANKFKEKYASLFHDLKQSYPFLLTQLEEWQYHHQLACDNLTTHLNVTTLDGYGLDGKVSAINAAGALLTYLKDVLLHDVAHIQTIAPYSTAGTMILDRMTQKNLELTEPLYNENKKNTLLAVIDRTQTPMGGRLIRNWIKQPLMNSEQIKARQVAVAEFVSEKQLRDSCKLSLQSIKDMERLTTKISNQFATPRDLIALKNSLKKIPLLKDLLQTTHSPVLREIESQLKELPAFIDLIERSIVEEPPLKISDGNFIREGFHKELDDLRNISKDSKAWIACYQTHLREQTGIKTLKVGYNRMFGYYIEVSKGQTDKMPGTFQRRQTLVNAERYISSELKNYETKVITAEERISGIESELFQNVKKELAKHSSIIFKMSSFLAKLDCLRCFAEVAVEKKYVCPTVHQGYGFSITEGRHPIIESIQTTEQFIPNDTCFLEDNERLLLITGPNMAGKSTFIRQVALITILAQMGSFVPAKKASIGVVDKVFTRIGASDDLSRGQSTFMVEMTEAANILNNVTSRSLVILDEIGRGTSTYDGISIAWAIAEYLLTAEGKQAKTLFATHYWELTKLEERVPGAMNYHVAVEECVDHIIFLHKILRGGTDKSYGIHVAKLAGMPSWVLERSSEILDHLEENANRESAFEPQDAKTKPKGNKRRNHQSNQMLLFN